MRRNISIILSIIFKIEFFKQIFYFKINLFLIFVFSYKILDYDENKNFFFSKFKINLSNSSINLFFSTFLTYLKIKINF